MATSIVTEPPSRAFSNAPIWVRLETDEAVSAPASVVLVLSASGPSAGQTLRLEWLGNDLLFTFVATDTISPLSIPIKGAETLAEYAAIMAEKIFENEVISAYFAITVTGTTVTLQQRVLAPVNITATGTLSGTTVTVTDVTSITAAPALRALLQVWSDTGNLATDTLLLSLHAPYPLPDTVVAFDIRSAFAGLLPAPPTEATINPIVFPTAQPYAQAAGVYTRYYLRHADKSGIPAVAQALIRSASYTAFNGHASAGGSHVVTAPLRHAYQRADKSTFIKPVTRNQPDYIFWVCPTGVTSVYLAVTAYWSDGTQSLQNPYGTTGVAVVAGEMYWFPAGYWQNKLHQATPSGSTDPEAYITGYRVQITRTDGSPLFGEHGVTYTIIEEGDWGAIYVLYDNGVGGMETVAFRGKWKEKYRTTSTEHLQHREYGWNAQRGDFNTYAAEGRQELEVNTGWFTDAYYISHLRQLSLAQKAYLVDVANRKFRACTIAPGDMEVQEADNTLYAQTFTIRAGWSDQSANV